MKIEGVPTRRRARIEMIPLIDCVFILLVFFIYSMLTMTIRRGVDVNLPDARMVRAADEEAIVVSITASGELMVDDLPVALAQLGPAMDNARSGREDAAVVVNADADSMHRRFVQVIDELKRSGVEKVVILSQETR